MLNICFLDTDTIDENLDLTALKRFGHLTAYKMTQPEQIAQRIYDQDIVIINSEIYLNETNLKDASRVKLICVAATGTNNVDLEYARSRGITVCNVPSYSTRSVAQHTFAMLFYLLESMPFYDAFVKSGQYQNSNSVNYLKRNYWELSNKTWGIIGLGTIGREVARIAEAFGCNIVYYSASGANNDSPYSRLHLEALLEQSDVVSIHAPLTSKTQYLIGYEQMRRMKRHAILLNLGRGGIINEDDLARAIDEGLIAGAGLDVLEQEPISPTNPLLTVKNQERLLITPHIAWGSNEAKQTLIDVVEMNIEGFLKGVPRNVVS